MSKEGDGGGGVGRYGNMVAEIQGAPQTLESGPKDVAQGTPALAERSGYMFNPGTSKSNNTYPAEPGSLSVFLPESTCALSNSKVLACSTSKDSNTKLKIHPVPRPFPQKSWQSAFPYQDRTFHKRSKVVARK